jgi:hypothetical protein
LESDLTVLGVFAIIKYCPPIVYFEFISYTPFPAVASFIVPNVSNDAINLMDTPTTEAMLQHVDLNLYYISSRYLEFLIDSVFFSTNIQTINILFNNQSFQLFVFHTTSTALIHLGQKLTTINNVTISASGGFNILARCDRTQREESKVKCRRFLEVLRGSHKLAITDSVENADSPLLLMISPGENPLPHQREMTTYNHPRVFDMNSINVN